MVCHKTQAISTHTHTHTHTHIHSHTHTHTKDCVRLCVRMLTFYFHWLRALFSSPKAVSLACIKENFHFLLLFRVWHLCVDTLPSTFIFTLSYISILSFSLDAFTVFSPAIHCYIEFDCHTYFRAFAHFVMQSKKKFERQCIFLSLCDIFISNARKQHFSYLSEESTDMLGWKKIS